jgi:hypothetical protein
VTTSTIRPSRKAPLAGAFLWVLPGDQAVPTLEIAPRKLPAEQTAVCKRFKLDLPTQPD